jgi:hypothetical protein
MNLSSILSGDMRNKRKFSRSALAALAVAALGAGAMTIFSAGPASAEAAAKWTTES